MSLKILAWNIEKFGKTKMSNHGKVICEVIRNSEADIVVILEPTNSNEVLNLDGWAPTKGNGYEGIKNLWDDLNEMDTDHYWNMINPLNLGSEGRSELVGVLFRNEKKKSALMFTGPWVFSNAYRSNTTYADTKWDINEIENTARSVCPHNFPYAGNYPKLVFLPNQDNLVASGIKYFDQSNKEISHPKIPTESNYNPGIDAGKVAAQYCFFKNGDEIGFPQGRLYDLNPDTGGKLVEDTWSMSPPGSRAPFLTTFYFDNGTTKFNLKLLSVHTSPSSAGTAMDEIRKIVELTAPNGKDEICVICGDFNVDSFKDNDSRNLYDIPNFALGLESKNGNAIDVERRPYCLTHLLNVSKNADEMDNYARLIYSKVTFPLSIPVKKQKELLNNLKEAITSLLLIFSYTVRTGQNYDITNYASKIKQKIANYKGALDLKKNRGIIQRALKEVEEAAKLIVFPTPFTTSTPGNTTTSDVVNKIEQSPGGLLPSNGFCGSPAWLRHSATYNGSIDNFLINRNNTGANYQAYVFNILSGTKGRPSHFDWLTPRIDYYQMNKWDTNDLTRAQDRTDPAAATHHQTFLTQFQERHKISDHLPIILEIG